ncbi:hypothetical protein GM921_04875 [Pedobacter sp. LMG 31464]|uniref:Uncharacterized protein n=1 Tax=Pedobacter planticolens TaxID=2679964 RepID=A0A923DXA8_9SPHI|nr:hypothetical protein [Pedobacter planticolens]MBB2144805.1 hypothetical protein [Pedobacter planticolens]
MELSLDALSAAELKLYYLIPEHLGFGDLENELNNNGTFDEYRNLHKSYFELFNITSSSIIKLEALKRLIFLNWYSIIEPSCFTGIENLDNDIISNSFSILNDYLTENKLDKEFKWMLTFYASWDYAILNFSENKFVNLTNFVKAVDTSISSFPKNTLEKGSMDNRGQMGVYWISMAVEIK